MQDRASTITFEEAMPPKGERLSDAVESCHALKVTVVASSRQSDWRVPGGRLLHCCLGELKCRSAAGLRPRIHVDVLAIDIVRGQQQGWLVPDPQGRQGNADEKSGQRT